MSLKHRFMEVGTLAIVDYIFFVTAEHYISSIFLRFLLIGIIDIFALAFILPMLRPFFNVVFMMLRAVGVRI